MNAQRIENAEDRLTQDCEIIQPFVDENRDQGLLLTKPLTVFSVPMMHLHPDAVRQRVSGGSVTSGFML